MVQQTRNYKLCLAVIDGLYLEYGEMQKLLKCSFRILKISQFILTLLLDAEIKQGL